MVSSGLLFYRTPDEDRPTKPLIRKNGTLVETSWEEAIGYVADKIKTIKVESGADALAALSSARCSNEDNYVFQKMMRTAIATNNVDHCARLCHASTVAGLAVPVPRPIPSPKLLIRK